jgi:hypothetical protein
MDSEVESRDFVVESMSFGIESIADPISKGIAIKTRAPTTENILINITRLAGTTTAVVFIATMFLNNKNEKQTVKGVTSPPIIASEIGVDVEKVPPMTNFRISIGIKVSKPTRKVRPNMPRA